MRDLTIVPRFGNKSFQLIEGLVGNVFSDFFKDFMKKYAGLNVYENVFMDKENNIRDVSAFDNFTSVYELTIEFINEYNRKLVPFAYDGGGWHYCLCMENGENYGTIILNRWTDHLPKEQFLIVADSFEDFINGLKREDEV